MKKICYIFSIKNHDIHKIITILGLKIKFKSKKLIEKKRNLDIDKKLSSYDKRIKKQENVISETQNQIENQNILINNLSNLINNLDKNLESTNNKIESQQKQINNLQVALTNSKNEIANKTNVINTLNRNFTDTLKRLTPQAVLKSFVYHLADHCNLKCQCCDHFAPLAQEKLADINEYERDIRRLGELSQGNIETIKLMGGEPLLHPQITDFMKISRQYFPHARIEIVTNGILLNQQNEIFWNTCKEYNITIVPTKYPLKIDYDKAKQTAKSYGVKYEYYNSDESVIKKSYHMSIDTEGKQNQFESFSKCYHANNCVMLKNGKLYTCTIAPNIEHFNKYFKYNLPLTEQDGIDIHNANSMDEILEKLARPIPFCKYCNINGRTFGHNWAISKKEISEWI